VAESELAVVNAWASPTVRVHRSLVKRGIDVVGAALGLVVVAPLLIVLGLIVKLDSPGPVVYVQTRVGLRGRTFRMLKLRTMRDGADDERRTLAPLSRGDDPRIFKIPRDPRVTRVGRSVRRWSLDELPQLYNVLVGDMSLVGPRPFVEPEDVPPEALHVVRLTVKPGITGLWQVSGRSDIVDFDEVVRLDRHYIEHWSLALDLRILARTVPTVLGRKGAY
jgi:lipopolysaccharide/colanic/teichoic acid biosynthesis glycosyltransferase